MVSPNPRLMGAGLPQVCLIEPIPVPARVYTRACGGIPDLGYVLGTLLSILFPKRTLSPVLHYVIYSPYITG